MDKQQQSKRVISYIGVGFSLVILLIWIDEILDLPHKFLGAPATQINWKESLLESLIVLLLGIAVAWTSRKTISRMRYLEGLLPICASCKKIRDDKGCWNQIEAYIHTHSDARFSHGICPECAKKLYPDIKISFDDSRSPSRTG